MLMFHIVNDQPYLGKIFCEIIESRGHMAKAFTCHQEYINHVKSSEFQMPLATITDVDMPIMNDYAMMGKIHHVNPEMRFIVTSGETAIKHEYKPNACIYLVNPFCLNAVTFYSILYGTHVYHESHSSDSV